tara:strand:+ start:210 stop:650 length:441 start_codon:yes stop_codon:yes gene_type:complete
MNLVRIPTSNADEVWNLVKKDIVEALSFSGNQTDADFVYESIKSEKMQLWVLWDKEQLTPTEKYYGVVVTEIIQRKLKRSCHVFIMTGRSRQKWTPLIKVLEDFAIEQECNQMELFARPGWQKVLQNFKYKRTHIVLEKQLIKENT